MQPFDTTLGLQMDDTYRFILGMITAVALCKYSQAEWNSTQVPAHGNHHDNSSNRTDYTDDHRWSGHFSECPKEFRHYCINGDCRFVKEQNTPSCRCENGFFGTRCEYLDLSHQVGERGKIVIACVVAGLLFLILFIAFICICTNKRYNPCRKKKRKNKTVDESEKLSSLNSNESAPVDKSDTNAV